ncbi:hypothetical protein [Mailhella massiliensis]|uniref:hypothetical protein n=1 Tax=Mailhella massiliensis TaxID=1903261 RepID=UPI001EF7226D|nr:hypothetical protein [Mailhella massiliensis]
MEQSKLTPLVANEGEGQEQMTKAAGQEELARQLKSATTHEVWLRDILKHARLEGRRIADSLEELKAVDVSTLPSEEEQRSHAETVALLEKQFEAQTKRIKRLKYIYQYTSNKITELNKRQEEEAFNSSTEIVLPVVAEQPVEKETVFSRILVKYKKYRLPAMIIAPVALALCYFLLIASPMYISQASFAIRSAETGSASVGTDITSVFLKSSSTSNDVYILEDYIKSLDLARRIDSELKFVDHYTDSSHDIISRLWKNPTQDELITYWHSVITPELDPDTGIINLNVRAYTPDMAQQLNQAILSASEALVNAMNERARHDAVELAREEVSRAEERVRHAQSAMREFRDTHNLIDPKSTAAGLQELVTRLEAEATTLRTQISEAKSYMNAEAPLLKSLNQRLAAVEKQLGEEKLRVAGQSTVQGNLNSLVAEYEDLTIEAEFAQKQLVSAMTSLEQARIQQMAQSRYVVAYQQPTLPDESLYPRPFLFTLYVFAALLLLLGIVSLVWASIREHAGF